MNASNLKKPGSNKNIETLREYPVTQTDIIIEKTIGSVSYAHYHPKTGKIYVAVNYSGQVPHLASIDIKTGQTRKLEDIKEAALFYVSSVTFDEERELLFYTTDNDSWHDLNVYHVRTGKSEILQKNGRTGDLAFNKADQSIWGVKHLNRFSTIVRIPYKDPDGYENGFYSTWQQMHTLDYGEDIFDIDISPDGKILSAAVSDLEGNQALLFYDLDSIRNENPSIDTVFNFDVSSPQTFRFTPDGRYLYGSSYYTGVSNIYRVNTETKEIHAMSNSLSGLLRPVYYNAEKLIAFDFTSRGFQSVFIPNQVVENVQSIEFLGNETVEKYTELQDWQLPIPSASDIDIEALKTNEGTYKPGTQMRINYGYPIVVGYKNNVGFGYTLNLADPFKFREFEFSVSYTPKSWDNRLSNTLSEDFDELGDDELLHISFMAKAGRFKLHGGQWSHYLSTESGNKSVPFGDPIHNNQNFKIMRLNQLLLALFAIALISSCNQQPHTHEEEKPDLEALAVTFQAMEDAYAKAQSAKDAEGVVVYYAEDAQNLPNNQPVVKGKAAILNRIKKDMATDTSNNVTSFEVMEVFAAGDLAVEIGKSTTRNADGEVVNSGKYMSLFEKRDGKYVCIRDIWNNDAPVPSE